MSTVFDKIYFLK